MMYRLAELSAAKGYGIYFLGSRPGVAEKAARRLWRLLREPSSIKRQAVLPLFVLRVLASRMALLSGRA